MKHKAIKLSPFPGDVVVACGLNDFKATYERLCRASYPFSDDDPRGGRYIRLEGGPNGFRYLVWGADGKALVHELTHVLLHVCGLVGHNPTEGDGEPFCYMLSSLMDQINASDFLGQA